MSRQKTIDGDLLVTNDLIVIGNLDVRGTFCSIGSDSMSSSQLDHLLIEHRDDEKIGEILTSIYNHLTRMPTEDEKSLKQRIEYLEKENEHLRGTKRFELSEIIECLEKKLGNDEEEYIY